jgi:hypothetical protein
VIISLGGGEVGLSKQYYNKSIVLTNYTIAIAETTQVITSGKPIYEEPIPASKNASLFDLAKKIVAFEKRLSDHMPEPDQASNITVLPQALQKAEFGLITSYSTIINYSRYLMPTNLFLKFLFPVT